jgi:hypothetical protein
MSLKRRDGDFLERISSTGVLSELLSTNMGMVRSISEEFHERSTPLPLGATGSVFGTRESGVAGGTG